ncbi:MAG: 2OG-Fe(II) oxygenase [Caulobacterales bacterium]|nr:2OG-Fe(II) oxygenase [Caulobacterales bacterium]
MALFVGDPLPALRLPGGSNPSYAVDTAGGRYVALGLLSGAQDDAVEAGIALIEANRQRFNDIHACIFGIVPDLPRWRERCRDQVPGVRWLFDKDGAVAKSLSGQAEPTWLLLDPTLRVLTRSGPERSQSVLEDVSSLPPPDLHMGTQAFAPVLLIPRIFEPDFCEALIDTYGTLGGEPSGFMREIDGVTRLLSDTRHKRRSDALLPEGDLRERVRARIIRRLVPQIQRAFQYSATRMERHLIACYDSETGGYFRPHRDNTTKGTAHRRFAVSINLNQDFDGGELRFPEYGSRTYRPPLGGAVVFSCSLLHEATSVTRGKRYAFLPFLYDDDAAQIREANLKYLDPALLEAGTTPG